MVIFNNDFKFAFNIEPPLKELKKEGYSVLGLNASQAERVLNAFVELNSENKIVRTIVLMKDAEFKNAKEYDERVKTNIVTMVRMGYKILASYHMTFSNGRSAEKIIYEVNGKKLCCILCGVHGTLVGSSVVIGSEGDAYDKELSSLFASITEF